MVLTRKKGESVAIADGEVTVTVVEIRGNQVRLGFAAAESIEIDRTEVHELKQRQRKEISRV